MHEEHQQLIEAEWAGALDEAGRRRLTELSAADPALTECLRQERRLSGLLGRLGPNLAPRGLAAAVFARLDAGEEIEEINEGASAGAEIVEATRPAPIMPITGGRSRGQVISVAQAMRKDSARTSRPRERWSPWLRWAMAATLLLAVGVEASLLLRQENGVRSQFDIIRVKLTGSKQVAAGGNEGLTMSQPGAAPTERTVAQATALPGQPKHKPAQPGKPGNLTPDRNSARKPGPSAQTPTQSTPVETATEKSQAPVAEPMAQPKAEPATELPEAPAAGAMMAAVPPMESPAPAAPPQPAPIEDRVVASAQPTPAVPVPALSAPAPAPPATAAATPGGPATEERTEVQAQADSDEPKRPTGLSPLSGATSPQTAAPPASAVAAATRANPAGDQMVAMRITLPGVAEPATGESGASRKNLDGMGLKERPAGGYGQAFTNSSEQTTPKPSPGQARRMTGRGIEIALARAGGDIVKREVQPGGDTVLECSMTPAQLQAFMSALEKENVQPARGAQHGDAAGHADTVGRYEISQGQKLIADKNRPATARKVTVRLVIRQTP